MKTMFNLSEKRINDLDNEWNYPERDVKEFIKKILEIGLLGIQRDKIIELAGKDLI